MRGYSIVVLSDEPRKQTLRDVHVARKIFNAILISYPAKYCVIYVKVYMPGKHVLCNASCFSR